jgi:hypothetical protein
VSGIDHPFRKALEIILGPDVSSVNCLLWQMHFLFQNGQANHYSTEPKLCLRASYDLSGHAQLSPRHPSKPRRGKVTVKSADSTVEIVTTQERAAARRLHLAAFTFGIPIAS